MKSIIILVLALMVLSLLWSLFVGAIKLAIFIGIVFLVLGALKAFLEKSNS